MRARVKSCSKPRMWAAIGAALLAASGAAAAMEIACPARVTMQPAVITDAPDGWQPQQRRTTLSVQDVVVTIGPPEERHDLKPDITMVNGRRSYNWRFVAAENEHGVWLSCGYGNTILLSQKLSTPVAQCQAQEPIVENGYRKLVITCR
ncbi:STY0301 family protein [Caballeronia sp. AZ10_KS36]|uniref:STY0301 family protein n=1 Tax=Caballeronia sp. AZ10_KS36 TaxID=2921757 RepID=UPI0032ED3606